MSSRPAIIRNAVDLPQPTADQHQELAVGDFEAEPVDGPLAVALGDVFESFTPDNIVSFHCL